MQKSAKAEGGRNPAQQALARGFENVSSRLTGGAQKKQD